jgi:hypothetical protein
MPELTIEPIPDFLKDITIEAPADTIDGKAKEVKDAKDKLADIVEPIKSLEELKKELEAEEEDKISEDKDSKEEKKEEKDKQEEVETAEPEYSFKPFIDIMAESGILDLEEGTEVGDTAEDLVQAFESTVTNRVIEGIDSYKESVPELGRRFLEYLEKGGDPKRFIEAQSGPIDLTTIDISDEGNQKIVLREYLKTQDYTLDEIKETLQDYEDGLLLEKQAKLAVKKLEKIQEQQTAILIKEQENEAQRRETEFNTYVSSVENLVKQSKELAGLELSDKDRKEFTDYLFKRDKLGLTSYQKELQEDPIKTQTELAYLKFKKYDFAKVAKKAENSAAKKFRDTVVSKSETTVKGNTADTNTKPADLSAFQKMFNNMKKQ